MFAPFYLLQFLWMSQSDLERQEAITRFETETINITKNSYFDYYGRRTYIMGEDKVSIRPIDVYLDKTEVVAHFNFTSQRIKTIFADLYIQNVSISAILPSGGLQRKLSLPLIPQNDYIISFDHHLRAPKSPNSTVLHHIIKVNYTFWVSPLHDGPWEMKKIYREFKPYIPAVVMLHELSERAEPLSRPSISPPTPSLPVFSTVSSIDPLSPSSST